MKYTLEEHVSWLRDAIDEPNGRDAAGAQVLSVYVELVGTLEGVYDGGFSLLPVKTRTMILSTILKANPDYAPCSIIPKYDDDNEAVKEEHNA